MTGPPVDHVIRYGSIQTRERKIRAKKLLSSGFLKVGFAIL